MSGCPHDIPAMRVSKGDTRPTTDVSSGHLMYNTEHNYLEIYHSDSNNPTGWRDLIINNKEQIDISGTVRCDGGLVVLNDFSLIGHAHLSDISVNSIGPVDGSLIILGDISVNGQIFSSGGLVGGGGSGKDASFNVIQEFSDGSGITFLSDVSINRHLYVLDASFGNNVTIGGILNINGDISNAVILDLSKNFHDLSGTYYTLSGDVTTNITNIGDISAHVSDLSINFIDLSKNFHDLSGTYYTLSGDLDLFKLNVKTNDLSVNNISVNSGNNIRFLSDVSFNQDVTITGDLIIDGSFNFNEVIQNITTVNNELLISTQLDICNQGTGPALEVTQIGTGSNNDVALFNSDVNDKAFEIIADGKSIFYKDVSFNGSIKAIDASFSGVIAFLTGKTNVGYLNSATNSSSTAVGRNNTASGTYSSAVGFYNDASGEYSTAVGYFNNASHESSIAVGNSNTASNTNSTAVGRNNTASGNSSSAFGRSNTASHESSTAVGNSNAASGTSSTAVGYNNTASGNYSVAIGYRAQASGGKMYFGIEGCEQAAEQIYFDKNATTGKMRLNCPSDILYSNMYLLPTDLPNANTYHGMFAHVHSTAGAYFSHAGNWVQLADLSRVEDLSFAVDAGAGGGGSSEDISINSAAITFLAGMLYDLSLSVDSGAGGGGGISPGQDVSFHDIDASGSITAVGDITAFFSSSDERLKKNIYDISNYENIIKNIRGVRFNWNDEAKNINSNVDLSKVELGVIAQEVEEYIPEIIKNGIGKYKAVRYEKITPILIECIKDLYTKVEKLEEEVRVLKM